MLGPAFGSNLPSESSHRSGMNCWAVFAAQKPGFRTAWGSRLLSSALLVSTAEGYSVRYTGVVSSSMPVRVGMMTMAPFGIILPSTMVSSYTGRCQSEPRSPHTFTSKSAGYSGYPQSLMDDGLDEGHNRRVDIVEIWQSIRKLWHCTQDAVSELVLEGRIGSQVFDHLRQCQVQS